MSTRLLAHHQSAKRHLSMITCRAHFKFCPLWLSWSKMIFLFIHYCYLLIKRNYGEDLIFSHVIMGSLHSQLSTSIRFVTQKLTQIQIPCPMGPIALLSIGPSPISISPKPNYLYFIFFCYLLIIANLDLGRTPTQTVGITLLCHWGTRKRQKKKKQNKTKQQWIVLSLDRNSNDCILSPKSELVAKFLG